MTYKKDTTVRYHIIEKNKKVVQDNKNRDNLHDSMYVGDSFEVTAVHMGSFLHVQQHFLTVTTNRHAQQKIEMKFYLIKKLLYSLYHRFNIVTDNIIKQAID